MDRAAAKGLAFRCPVWLLPAREALTVGGTMEITGNDLTVNPARVRGIRKAVTIATEQIASMAKPVAGVSGGIAAVASISANNDEEVGQIAADTAEAIVTELQGKPAAKAEVAGAVKSVMGG